MTDPLDLVRLGNFLMNVFNDKNLLFYSVMCYR